MKKPKKILAPANWVVDEKKRKKRPLTTSVNPFNPGQHFDVLQYEEIKVLLKSHEESIFDLTISLDRALKGWRNTLILLAITFTTFVALLIYSLTHECL